SGPATGAALARALGANRRAGKRLGRASTAASRLPGTPRVPREAPAGRSRALSRPVAFTGEAIGPRRIRARASRPAGGGTLWACREGLHPFDGAEPAFP